jgi:hypothetical protein
MIGSSQVKIHIVLLDQKVGIGATAGPSETLVAEYIYELSDIRDV